MNLFVFFRKLRRVLFDLSGVPLKMYAIFVPTNAKCWVFGNIQGYRDNSRYLFEYVLRNCNDIKAVWIANDESECQKVISLGGRSVLRGSFDALRVISAAKVGFISISLRDLTLPITRQLYVVDLFHGIPLKKLGLDAKTETQILAGKSFLNKINTYLLRKSLNRYDLVIAASKLCQDRFVSSFGIPTERVPICGQPRTDIFVQTCNSDGKNSECTTLPEKFILFVPTWRESGKNPLDYFDLDIWDIILSEIDYKLVVKLHPLTKPIEKEIIQENIIFLNDSNIEFTHLLYHTDILITDYSSAMFDFSLLGRPILLFVPDKDEYDETRGLYEPIENLGQEIIFNEEDELIAAIKESIAQSQKYGQYSKLISERYNHFNDGKNCERVVDAVLERINGSVS